MVSSPVKGIIHTTTAIPKGVMRIVSSIHEGFDNMPKLYGSDVRKPGKVTDLSSGIREGGKVVNSLQKAFDIALNVFFFF